MKKLKLTRWGKILIVFGVMKKLFLFLVLAFYSGTANAQDMITLQSGESLQGQILYYDNYRAKILTNEGARMVAINNVSSVQSQNRVIESQMNEAINNAGSYVYDSYAAPSSNSIRNVNPAPNAVPLASAAADVTDETLDSAEETKELFWGAEWSGNINLGADLKTGNSESNGINADARLDADWGAHKAWLEGEYNREEDDGDVNVDNRWAQLGHDYFFAEKWFVESTGKYEQDEIADIDYRATLTSGLGYQPYDDDDLSLKFVLGPGYQFEEYKNGTSEDSLIVNWAMDYSQKFYDDLFRLFHNHDLSAPTEDFDAWLFQSESGIRVPIRRGIVATGEIDFDWDNDPAPGTKEDDTTYAVKLGYEW